MASAGRGNRIVLTPDRGYKVEGIIAAGQTPAPGTCVQIDPTVALQGGRHTWKIYDRAADGDRPAGPHIILTEDLMQGKTMTDAYAAGARAFGFIPLPGCEINLLHHNVSGTADDVVAGDLLIIDDGTGLFHTTTGSPQSEPAMALEANTDPTTNNLVWSIWSGH